MPLAIDLHAQRQVKPRRRGSSVVVLRAAMGLHLYRQRVGMGDPVGERCVQRDHKTAIAQHAVIVISPVQPGLLGFSAGNAKLATFGGHET